MLINYLNLFFQHSLSTQFESRSFEQIDRWKEKYVNEWTEIAFHILGNKPVYSACPKFNVEKDIAFDLIIEGSKRCFGKT